MCNDSSMPSGSPIMRYGNVLDLASCKTKVENDRKSYILSLTFNTSDKSCNGFYHMPKPTVTESSITFCKLGKNLMLAYGLGFKGQNDTFFWF